MSPAPAPDPAGVLHPTASPPPGLTFNVDSYTSEWGPALTASHGGPYDEVLFPAWREAIDPSTTDWAQAEISDVRTFLGEAELFFWGNVTITGLQSPDSSQNPAIAIRVEGAPGTGTVQTIRQFLQEGTLAFRVNGGDYNTMKFQLTQAEAESLVPSPDSPGS